MNYKNKLKITTPIDSVDEFKPLLDAGADSFYCSFQYDGINLGTPRNSNPKSYNLASFEEFELLASKVRFENKELMLAFNSPVMKGAVLAKIKKEILNKIVVLKPDAIIVGSLELLAIIDAYVKGTGIKIILSSLFELKNVQSIDFLKKRYNFDGVILDRPIDLLDLETISNNFPELEIEVFGFSAGCRSLASACNYTTYIGKHLCFYDFSIKVGDENTLLKASVKKAIEKRLSMPGVCCGTCAMYFFALNKVDRIKLVGRGYPLQRKLANLKPLFKAKKMLSIKNKEEFFKKMQDEFKKDFGRACKKEECYYPHFFSN